jgi:hypothetical protein
MVEESSSPQSMVSSQSIVVVVVAATAGGVIGTNNDDKNVAMTCKVMRQITSVQSVPIGVRGFYHSSESVCGIDVPARSVNAGCWCRSRVLAGRLC